MEKFDAQGETSHSEGVNSGVREAARAAAVAGLTLISATPADTAHAGEPIGETELMQLRQHITIAPDAQRLMDKWRVSLNGDRGEILVGGAIPILRFEKGAVSAYVALAEGENPDSDEDDALFLMVTNDDGSKDFAVIRDADPSPGGMRPKVRLGHIPPLQ